MKYCTVSAFASAALFAAVFAQNTAYADCITGYACPIKELKEQEALNSRNQINGISKPLEGFFDKNIDKSNEQYKRLFPYTEAIDYRHFKTEKINSAGKN